MCSVDDVEATILEVARVLKKNGRYGFVEHVAAEDGNLAEDIYEKLNWGIVDFELLVQPEDVRIIGGLLASGGRDGVFIRDQAIGAPPGAPGARRPGAHGAAAVADLLGLVDRLLGLRRRRRRRRSHRMNG